MAHGFLQCGRQSCVHCALYTRLAWCVASRCMYLKVCFTVPFGKGANSCGPRGLFGVGLLPEPIIC